MNNISKENRKESLLKMNKKARERQVLEILSDGIERTAREVAEEMYLRGYTATSERNNASPRLTALLEKREVVICGKVLDHTTGKNVAVYRIAKKLD